MAKQHPRPNMVTAHAPIWVSSESNKRSTETWRVFVLVREECA